MMAATRSQKRVTGGPEDVNKNPSKFQKELAKISQKNKKSKVAVEKQGDALEKTTTVTSDVPELPFVNVPPLPSVERGKTKTNSAPTNKDIIDKLLGIPKLSVEPGFKNRAPLQSDERAKDLV